MDARRWGLALALAVAACASPETRTNGQFVEHGRQYTAWLYGNEYNKLWDRFSPEMRQTFGSVADLATFAGRAVTQLGRSGGWWTRASRTRIRSWSIPATRRSTNRASGC